MHLPFDFGGTKLYMTVTEGESKYFSVGMICTCVA